MKQIDREELQLVKGSHLDGYLTMLSRTRVRHEIWRDGATVYVYSHNDCINFKVTICYHFDFSTGICTYSETTEVESN